MNIQVEEARNYVKVSKNLLDKVEYIIKQISSDNENNFMENDFKFEYGGNTITNEYRGESNWDDEGKYQYQSEYRQLVMKDENDNIIKFYNLFFKSPITRSGSYFSDYYYIYNKPIIQIADIKHIEEQIIPAHDVVDFVNV